MVLSLVLLTAITHPVSAQTGRRIDIPGTAGAAFTLPPGWDVGPGNEGAVLLLQAPDGNAQIMVNLVTPDPGQTAAGLRDMLADATRQQVFAAGLPVTQQPTQNANLGGRIFRVDSFPINDPAQPLLLEFVYVVHEQQLLVFNISAAQQAPQRIAEARQSVQSLTGPASVAKITTAPPVHQASKQVPMPTATGGVASADLRALLNQETQLLSRLRDQGHYSMWVRELATIRTRIAELHAAAHDWDPAVAYLSSAVELDPTHADRFELLADLLDNIPAPAAPFLAQSYYEDALEVDPRNRACRVKLASSYQATGELRDAMVHYQILARNEGGTPDPAVLQDLCITYLGAGEEQRGAAFLEQIVMDGAPAEFCLAWAILKDACGDPAEAARLAHYTASVAPNAPLQTYAQKLALGFEKKGGLQ